MKQALSQRGAPVFFGYPLAKSRRICYNMDKDVTIRSTFKLGFSEMLQLPQTPVGRDALIVPRKRFNAYASVSL